MLLALIPYSAITHAHGNNPRQANQTLPENLKATNVRYLANEGIMIQSGTYKILFDPFFHNDYGQYQLVPKDILNAIMSNTSPYDNIDAIFISHAHEDHFTAKDMLRYLLKYPKTKLIAPSQAIDEIKKLEQYPQISNILSRIHPIQLAYGDPSHTIELDNMIIDAVRIPHAGWPGRANISNIVFRVTLPDGQSSKTFIHMGDADPKDEHFLPYKSLWSERSTDLAFPPYWFMYSIQGNYILDYRLNAHSSIGVHVPINVPQKLKDSGKAFFDTPGEQYILGNALPNVTKHKH